MIIELGYDSDADGIPAELDNCPFVSNSLQYDTDNDGLGNACDTDVDDDGINNPIDNCLFVSNSLQYDTDNDGLGNACDTDVDDDGIDNTIDNCPFVSNSLQYDTDNDGLGNACDTDVDDDGINNPIDNCPFVSNSLQYDTDNDGLGNACDTDVDDDGINNPIDNCIFVSNFLQIDDNLDGIGDACQLPLPRLVTPPLLRENIPPVAISTSIIGGETIIEGNSTINIIGPSCESGNCNSLNSMVTGFNSTSSQLSFIRNILILDSTTLGLPGTQIENMTLNLGGCWNGGHDFTCSVDDNPGFSAGGGILRIAIWNGNNWESFEDIVPLGNYLSSSSDEYNSFMISKSSGFLDQHVENNLIKILIQTGGQTQDDLDISQVIDFAFLEITYNLTP